MAFLTPAWRSACDWRLNASVSACGPQFYKKMDAHTNQSQPILWDHLVRSHPQSDTESCSPSYTRNHHRFDQGAATQQLVHSVRSLGATT